MLPTSVSGLPLNANSQSSTAVTDQPPAAPGAASRFLGL